MNIRGLKELIRDLPDDMPVYTTGVYQGESYVEEDVYPEVTDIYAADNGLPGRATVVTLYESETEARSVTTRPLTTFKALMI